VWNPKDGIIDTNALPESISVENLAKLSLTTNLAAAIRHVRLPQEALTFWSDAVCINQSSDLEKNLQVALMGKTYSSAQDVLIWLGPAKDHSDLSWRLLQRD
jgi:hypothetical protein